jgi:hypothetical protein
MSTAVTYLRITEGGALPESASPAPFRAVVVAEEAVSAEWQASVSEWLVHSGCLYMVAWGANCSSWDDSVDMANLEEFEFKEIPEDKFVMTTWHENESLSEALWFAKNNACHPTVALEHTLLLHISAQNGEQELLRAYGVA